MLMLPAYSNGFSPGDEKERNMKLFILYSSGDISFKNNLELILTDDWADANGLRGFIVISRALHPACAILGGKKSNIKNVVF